MDLYMASFLKGEEEPAHSPELNSKSPGRLAWITTIRTLGFSKSIATVLALFFICLFQVFWFQRFLPRFAAPIMINQSRPADTPIDSVSIHVISLPSRTDRRATMEHLRKELGLRWTYVDAISSEDPLVDRLLAGVRFVRSAIANSTNGLDNTSSNSLMQGPKNIDSIALSTRAIRIQKSKFWVTTITTTPAIPLDINGSVQVPQPMTCATGAHDVVPYSNDLAEYRILTGARLACWQSHISVLERIANDNAINISVVLEDDIDMERDFSERLRQLWPALPEGWDMVFLGHCWSNESHYPALESTPYYREDSRIHPSWNPKCTHAYAMSRAGARRLLLHLLHPPLAYSRAIDQAFAWLIRTKKVTSYSLVPSIAVQTKTGRSDIAEGKGSTWKDSLSNGVFGS